MSPVSGLQIGSITSPIFFVLFVAIPPGVCPRESSSLIVIGLYANFRAASSNSSGTLSRLLNVPVRIRIIGTFTVFALSIMSDLSQIWQLVEIAGNVIPEDFAKDFIFAISSGSYCLA